MTIDMNRIDMEIQKLTAEEKKGYLYILLCAYQPELENMIKGRAEDKFTPILNDWYNAENKAIERIKDMIASDIF